jgi:hypothetical protein
MRHRQQLRVEEFFNDWCYLGLLVIVLLILVAGLSSLWSRDRVKAYVTGIFILLFLLLILGSLCNWWWVDQSAAVRKHPAPSRQEYPGRQRSGLSPQALTRDAPSPDVVLPLGHCAQGALDTCDE